MKKNIYDGSHITRTLKRHYMLSAFSLLMLVLGGYYIYMAFSNLDRNLQVTLVESKVIDVDKLYEAKGFIKDTEETWWTCIGSQYVADWMSEDYGITIPETDFSKNKLLVILGRQIISAKSVKSGISDVGRIPYIIVSKVYEDKTMFVYSYQGDAFGPYHELFVEDDKGIHTLHDYLSSN